QRQELCPRTEEPSGWCPPWSARGVVSAVRGKQGNRETGKQGNKWWWCVFFSIFCPYSLITDSFSHSILFPSLSPSFLACCVLCAMAVLLETSLGDMVIDLYT